MTDYKPFNAITGKPYNGGKSSCNVYKQYTVFHASQVEGIPPYVA